jgi:hypothetical protein
MHYPSQIVFRGAYIPEKASETGVVYQTATSPTGDGNLDHYAVPLLSICVLLLMTLMRPLHCPHISSERSRFPLYYVHCLDNPILLCVVKLANHQWERAQTLFLRVLPLFDTPTARAGFLT